MNVVFSALNPPYRNPDFPAATLLLLLAARSVTLGQALNLSLCFLLCQIWPPQHI